MIDTILLWSKFHYSVHGRNDKAVGDLYLDEVPRDRIDEITEAKLKMLFKPLTINRLLQVIRAILNKALRIRWLTPDKVHQILIHFPDHLSAVVQFSLATGIRELNITGLEWNQVDLTRRVAS